MSGADVDEDRYDAVVIGAGSGGEVLAAELAGAGWKVAIVEERLVGGDCPFWACMPSKALLRPVAVADATVRHRGVQPGRIDADDLFAWRDEVVKGFDDGDHERQLVDAGVELIRGRGRLVAERVVQVEGPGGSRTLHVDRQVVLATGSTSLDPGIDGLSATHVWSSADATTASEVPGRLLVLGGGAVGCELGQLYARLGSDVTLVERDPHLLGLDDDDVAEAAADILRRDGVRLHLGVEVGAARTVGDGVVVELDDEEVTVDRVLLAAGRRPVVDDIGLDRVGLDPAAFSVDERLRVEGVAGDWLSAIGDVVGRVPTTHHAKYQARVLGGRLLRDEDGRAWADDRAPVQVTFVDPPVARVGLTASEARDRGHDVRVLRTSLAETATAYVHAASESPAAGAVIVEGDRIVGAELVGPGADEVVHAFTVAIVGQVPLERLGHAVPAFPTQAEAWLALV